MERDCTGIPKSSGPALNPHSEMGVMTVWHPYGEGGGAGSRQGEAPTQQCGASEDTSTYQGSTGPAPALPREGRGGGQVASHCLFHQAKAKTISS